MPKHLLPRTTTSQARTARHPRRSKGIPALHETKAILNNNPTINRDIHLKATLLKAILRKVILLRVILRKATPRNSNTINNNNNSSSKPNPAGLVAWGCPLRLALVVD
jgi:hypothetical protein